MGRTLTILAKRPDDLTEVSPEDPAIDAVRKAIEPFQSEDYSLKFASTVRDVAEVLEDDLASGTPPSLVQIIGHGRPGILFLGATWTGVASRADGAHVIECNLNRYGLLADWVKRGTTVWLLGCEVGALADPLSPKVEDGPTLLFALSRMWGTEVAAPDHMVLPGDFSDGVYKHRDFLQRAHGLRVELAAHVPVHGPPQNGVGAWRK